MTGDSELSQFRLPGTAQSGSDHAGDSATTARNLPEQAEQADDRLVQFLYATLHHVDDGVLACDAARQITVMNRSMSGLLGVDQCASLPLRLPDGVSLRPADSSASACESLLERPLRGEAVSDEEWTVRRADGDERRVLVTAHPLTERGGEVFGSVLVFKDVTEQRRYEDELRHLATHDALTGLPNRRLLLERLQEALSAGPEERATVLMCDVDHFKEINDTFGHDHGDHLLIQLSERLLAATTAGDTLARLGGDEFVLVSKAADEQAAHEAARRMVDVFRLPFEVGGHTHPISISVGMVLAGDDDTAELLLQHADAALYLAKERGGRRYERFEDNYSVAAARRLVARELLANTLGAGDVLLNYQPVLSLASGRIMGAEALVRLSSPDGEMLLPAQFLDIAERSGLQTSLDLAVLCEAVAATVRLHRRLGAPAVGLTCNLSGRQLSRADLADQVLDCLDRNGLTPGLLSLELAGHDQLDVDSTMRANLIRLTETGVRLGLDDFGVAQGTFSLLLDLPFAYVKVGHSLLRRLPSDARNMAILDSVVQTASTLGLEVRAEGVELQEQATTLERLGVAFAQGFLYWPPLTERAYADLVEATVSSWRLADRSSITSVAQ
jgi:diguanylate cyclase (GGDEF)-like protein/PAS domain S-box-containing protein